MTNLEKIQNMNAEQMAGFLKTIYGGSFKHGGIKRIDGEKVQWDEIEQWLNSEVKNYATTPSRELIFQIMDKSEYNCIDTYIKREGFEQLDIMLQCMSLRDEGILVYWGTEHEYTYTFKGKRLTKEQKTYVPKEGE